MAYLRRKIDAFLLQWKQDSAHKPLVVQGMRGIGKAESIRHFAQGNYESVVEINFAREEAYKTITLDGADIEEILHAIVKIDPGQKFLPGKTLVFFNEIQEFPGIAALLRSFSADPRYDVICSGSYLGVHYRKKKKTPSASGTGPGPLVPYKQDYSMHSMDFEEFLWAFGCKDDDVQKMLRHMKSLQPFSEEDLKYYSDFFLKYCVLGGMPAVVSAYLERENFHEAFVLQRQLLSAYEEDIRKYAGALDTDKLLRVWHSIPVQLSKTNKKFQFSAISSTARAREYSGCVEWLKRSGLVSTCRFIEYPKLPLRSDASRFKLFFTDTGLLSACFGDEAQEEVLGTCELGIREGALCENLISEALKKQGLSLYCYRRENSRLALDFFLRLQKELLPLEVKAVGNNTKSLSTVIKSEKYPDIQHGIRFSSGNIGVKDNILSFPYFCAFLLKRVFYWSSLS